MVTLGGIQVADVGLEQLKGLTQLQYLTLENTQVSDAGIAGLQQALPNCRITKQPRRPSCRRWRPGTWPDGGPIESYHETAPLGCYDK